MRFFKELDSKKSQFMQDKTVTATIRSLFKVITPQQAKIDPLSLMCLSCDGEQRFPRHGFHCFVHLGPSTHMMLDLGIQRAFVAPRRSHRAVTAPVFVCVEPWCSTNVKRKWLAWLRTQSHCSIHKVRTQYHAGHHAGNIMMI